ncbi:hypothetical protein PanWU01x14_210830 [Parasponia andersonii]|uniref:Uncharacterized protein n=1 Tax=Parasponia andersonii TaxID=3476 RepID=A0A2P5BTW6_PARAD|nr:hypothetical protein PanWU01x14_210830 [Parasponia andersonii]
MALKRIRLVDIKTLVATGRSDVYTGSAFAISPISSLLPLLSFSKKMLASAVVDDSASRDLGCLLRIG